MPTRKELVLRACAVNIDHSAVPNDSVLEQKIIYAETHLAASTTAVTLLPPAVAATLSGGANV